MPTIFQCPDCRGLHEEPLVAIFALAARCEDCDLAFELAETFDVGSTSMEQAVAA